MPTEGVDKMGVVGQEIFLPLSEVVREGVIGLFRHDVLLDLVDILDFLVDGVRIEVHDVHNHVGLCPIEVEGPHLLLHIG